MSCQRFQELMMGYIDSELGEEEKTAFLNHVKDCPQCSSELAHFQKLKEVTNGMTLSTPEEQVWADYWSGMYNRLERGIGWVLLSLCGIFLLIYGGYKAVEECIEDPTVGLLVKVAILGFIAGIAVLFVSVLRERIFFWKTDRYRNVRR
jgi:hypothetical protein